MEHTPGDWKVLKVHDGEYQITAPGQGKYEGESSAIARLCSWDREPPIEQLEGNALLFAAAPDLLAACEAALKMIDALTSVMYGQNLDVAGWHHNGDMQSVDSFFDDNSDGSELEQLRSAIAKARGTVKA